MKPSRTFIVILVLLPVAAAAAIVLTPCNAIKQQLNMRRAAAHVESLGPDFLRDPRFVAVTVEVHTGGACGCMLVRGWVPTDDDLEALKAKVGATNPPVEVRWTVQPAYEEWPRIWDAEVPEARRGWFPAPEGAAGGP